MTLKDFIKSVVLDIGAANDEIRNETDERLRMQLMDNIADTTSMEEYRKQLIADAENYLGFLDRSYEELRKFIAAVEAYK